MDFIEKIVGLMGGKPAQPEDGSTDVPDSEITVHPQDAPRAEVEETGQSQEPKTYTPEEVESILSDRKKEWQAEQEAKEQERLLMLPETERLKQEQLSREAEIASLRAELSRRDLQSEVIAKLDERRLPVGIADLVQYGDRESTMASLDKLMNVVESAVQEGVMLRLRGKTPEGLGRAATSQNHLTDTFAKAFSDAFKK